MKATSLAYPLVVVLTSVLCSCADILVPEGASELNLQDFEAAWRFADEYYPFFTFKNVNWDSLRVAFEPRAACARGDELYPLLFALFVPLRDGHIEVQSEAGYPMVNYRPPRAGDARAFDPVLLRKYFPKPLSVVGGNKIELGLVDEAVGYIRFSTFAKGDWVREVDEPLERLLHTLGLIVDVRNNTGGSGKTYGYILPRLIDRPVVETAYYWDGSVRSGTIQPAARHYTGKLVVLINGASFSAAEVFTELLRQLPSVTVVGDTSGGGGGDTELFVLPSGKKLRLPVKYFRRHDGEMIEWNGVIPDVVVEQSVTDILRQRDLQLEKAIVLARKGL